MIFIVCRHSKWGICAKSFPKTTKNLKPGCGGILTEWFFAVRVPHSNWGGGIFGIRGGILTFILTVYIYILKWSKYFVRMYAWIHSDRKLLLTYWLYLNMCIYIYMYIYIYVYVVSHRIIIWIISYPLILMERYLHQFAPQVSSGPRFI